MRKKKRGSQQSLSLSNRSKGPMWNLRVEGSRAVLKDYGRVLATEANFTRYKAKSQTLWHQV